uniref:BTB domain-containing protein n=1 Tax=Gorilla gorilla gorilla TaxID=9595 RepID=A0A2I2Z5G7_GORGO
MEAEETMQRLQEFRERQDCFTDITLIVDGHHLKAHKAVLAACSHVLPQIFFHIVKSNLNH